MNRLLVRFHFRAHIAYKWATFGLFANPGPSNVDFYRFKSDPIKPLIIEAKTDSSNMEIGKKLTFKTNDARYFFHLHKSTKSGEDFILIRMVTFLRKHKFEFSSTNLEIRPEQWF